MSNTYLALIDPTATPANAAARADSLRQGLIGAGIISTETSDQCVLNGIGHLPGERLSQIYRFDELMPEGPPELNYWSMLQTCGVEIHAERWVNFWGFTVFHWSQCPACQKRFPEDHEVMEDLTEAAAQFYLQEGSTQVNCPACGQNSDIREWTTKPHLGFCYMAAVFWNWPDFDAPGWHESIPDIASRSVGVPLITSFGRI